jgi:flagellin-like protein
LEVDFKENIGGKILRTIKPLKKLYKDAKAISPLVATLLLIAIAVAASVITYSWVMSMIGAQSQQAQTQIRIDMVDWGTTDGLFTSGDDNITLTVRNTGSVPADIESISVRVNQPGETWYTDDSDDATGAIDVGDATTFDWNEADASSGLDFLENSASYLIRVTTSTGFYYEQVAATPAAP